MRRPRSRFRRVLRAVLAWAACLAAAAEVASIAGGLMLPIADRTAFVVVRGGFGIVSNGSGVHFRCGPADDDFAWWFNAGGIMGVGWLIAPIWLPLSILALGWATMRLLDRPPPAWSCRRCGYDRRGLAPASPCPECGDTPPPPRPASSCPPGASAA